MILGPPQIIQVSSSNPSAFTPNTLAIVAEEVMHELDVSTTPSQGTVPSRNIMNDDFEETAPKEHIARPSHKRKKDKHSCRPAEDKGHTL